jgi:hypothetical protein
MKRQRPQESGVAQHQKFKDAAAALDCTHSDNCFHAALSRIIRSAADGSQAPCLPDDQDVAPPSRALPDGGGQLS